VSCTHCGKPGSANLHSVLIQNEDKEGLDFIGIRSDSHSQSEINPHPKGTKVYHLANQAPSVKGLPKRQSISPPQNSAWPLLASTEQLAASIVPLPRDFHVAPWLAAPGEVQFDLEWHVVAFQIGAQERNQDH
jgi:hypothetical protein